MLRERVSVPDDKVQSYVSGMLAAYAGSSVLFSIPAGWIADRTSARQTPFLAGLAALLGATLLLAFGQSIAVLILARVLQGISGALVWTVGLAMVLDTVGPQNLGKVIGTIFSFISVGELAAPVLGGVLYKKTGYAGVFGLGAGVLGLDFVMRVLLIEKKTAKKYDPKLAGDGATNPRDHGQRDGADSDDEGQQQDAGEAGESDALLPKKEDEEDFTIPDGQNRLVRALPILYCLSDPRLLVALLLAFVQASLLATFDATIPTEAETLFEFNSLQSGLLFIALDIPYLILGPIAGWACDKYGPKVIAVLGFGYLAPALVLLRLPAEEIVDTQKHNIILYCGMLSLVGTGMAIIGSPSIVEASSVVQKYDKANPKFFGENGPYAQLYGFNSLVFSAGLTIGPILSGTLRDSIGYGNMNAVLAGIAGTTALLSFIYVGGKPKLLRKGRKY
jgi:MFS family permease